MISLEGCSRAAAAASGGYRFPLGERVKPGAFPMAVWLSINATDQLDQLRAGPIPRRQPRSPRRWAMVWVLLVAAS
jgi:hypothetical protein